jgi:hypothetical protein
VEEDSGAGASPLASLNENDVSEGAEMGANAGAGYDICLNSIAIINCQYI